MNRETLYKCFLEAIPRDVCHHISRELQFLKLQPARVGGHESSKLDVNVRRSRVGFVEQDNWLTGLLFGYVFRANKDIWRFDLAEFGGVQYSVYSGEEYYDWHKDEFTAPIKEIGGGMLNRKLTAVLTLYQSPDENTGIFLRDPWGREIRVTPANNAGSILVFPSYVLHRAQCCSEDRREALTLWALGPPFK